MLPATESTDSTRLWRKTPSLKPSMKSSPPSASTLTKRSPEQLERNSRFSVSRFTIDSGGFRPRQSLRDRRPRGPNPEPSTVPCLSRQQLHSAPSGRVERPLQTPFLVQTKDLRRGQAILIGQEHSSDNPSRRNSPHVFRPGVRG